LRSLAHPPEEIIVIDNGSSDGTREYLESVPKLVHVLDSRPCLPALFNLGWRLSTMPIVAFLNDDAVVEGAWTDEIRAAFETLPDAAMIGGPTLDQADRRMRSMMGQSPVLFRLYDIVFLEGKLEEYGVLTEWGSYSIGRRFPNVPKIVDALTITNMAVRRDCLAELGGFDEDFQYSNFDGFFFLRARQRNFRAYSVPTARVLHYPNPRGNTRSAYYLSRDYAVWYRKMMPAGVKSKLLARMGRWAQLAFWFRAATLEDNAELFFEALRGNRDGSRAALRGAAVVESRIGQSQS